MQGYTTRKTVHLCPNAFDTGFLRPEMAGRTAPREGPLVIGYVGHLGTWWFDWEALAEIARRMPDAEFEIIGFGGPERPQVPPNVRLLGPKDHAEVNEIAKRWRAAMVLRKISTLTAAMDSLKVYEYLALGLPMVCFTMPQIESYPYVFSAPDVEGFVAQARRAASEPIDRGRIDAFLAVNRWEDRVDQILRLAEEAAAQPPPLRGLQEARLRDPAACAAEVQPR
jgi:glycosyltransferase involved in cell wall biosynthesis